MKKLWLIAVVATFFSGCLKSADCNYNECDAVAPASEIQEVQTYLTANSIAATQHCSGMFYVIDQQGSDKKPTACQTITLHYEGKLTNGTVFETKLNEAVSFSLAGTVPGFTNALIQLNEGGKMRFFIPPSLGYGSQQRGSIPPNSILVFSVELLDVQ